ncbi:MAG: cytochrome b/b6, partial [Zetaproteobacteria bacterium]
MLERFLNTRFMQWVDARTGLVQYIRHHVIDYPTPRNLNLWWAFGSIGMTVLVLQVISGVWLAMDYKPSAIPTGHGFTMAFDSVEHIMRDVPFGWLVRYMHAVGASLFFAAIYLHVARGMYYGSYKKPRELLWVLGVVILIVMQATVFFGYLLPWGQMSYWGATVITNIVAAIPGIGPWLGDLIRGDYGLSDASIGR